VEDFQCDALLAAHRATCAELVEVSRDALNPLIKSIERSVSFDSAQSTFERSSSVVEMAHISIRHIFSE
jgi:hypothetical protein